MSWKERFERKLAKWGEYCYKNGTTEFRAFPRPLDQAFWNLYFDMSESAFLARPGYMFLVSASLTFTVSDSVTYCGTSYPIKKIFTTFIANVGIVQTLLCAISTG